jgi:hypothetical protein
MNHIEKIKKLLRLARDKAASPAEAAQALARAMELIARHDLDLGEINLDEPTEKFIRDHIHVGLRVSLVKKLVIGILQSFFHVRVCLTSPRLAILGRESDVQIASYVFAFLVRSCAKAFSAWAQRERASRRKISTGKKESFIRGWIYGVSSNLEPVKAQIEDSGSRSIILMRQAALEDFYSQEFPHTRTITIAKGRENTRALVSGWHAGKQTNVRTPLNSGAEPLSLE